VSALLEFRHVAFAYQQRDRRPAFAIDDLSFSVGAREIFGIIGPNASGKTTLIRLLSKVLSPARGEILLDGESLADLSRATVARRIAVVPQDVPSGFPHSVEDLVLMGRFPHAPGRYFESDEDVRAGEEAMTAAGVLELRREPIDRLSGGERQRVVLARALCQRSSLLVLDEPTAHLDLRHQAECVGLLRRLNRASGLTIVLISHDLNLAAEMCDRLLLLHAGSAVSVGRADVVLDESTLESVYGCRVVVDKHPASRRPIVQIVWPDPEGR
jgi:iron complex transport system ATP-binding protein